jgi:hypothetical protein
LWHHAPRRLVRIQCLEAAVPEAFYHRSMLGRRLSHVN